MTQLLKNTVQHPTFTKTFFKGLMVSFGLCSLVYMYFLGTIIFNIINRKTIDQEARVLTSDIGTLELRYLSRTQELDLAYAQARGFVEPRELHFAQKVTTEKGLSFRTPDDF